MTEQPKPCRTTQHCAVHDFCHRCMPSLNEATRHLVKAIAAAGITTGTGRVYAELAATIRDAARQTTGQTDTDCPACPVGIKHTEHCPTPETHNWGCGCPTDERLVPAVGQPAEAQATDRCPSCEHGFDIHDADGRCWFTVQQGVPERDIVCPCKLRRQTVEDER